MKIPPKNQAGFTLIEYIVAVVIVAIIASMVYSYFGSALTQSSAPIARLQQASNLYQVMENIVADYNRLNTINLRYKWQPSNPYRIGSVITPSTIPVSPNGGHYYKCTTAGTSSATEPTWLPVVSGGTKSDGTAVWTESGNIIWQASNSYSLNSIVVPKLNNGHYYKRIVTTGTGTSSANEPTTWPTTTSGTVVDGGVTWTEVGTILDRSNTGLTDSLLLDSLKYYLDNNPGRYGAGYTVVAAQTKFIKFSSAGVEEDAAGADEKSVLKVTIKSNASSETLTQLFTIR